MRIGDCERLLDAAEELIARDMYQEAFEDQLQQSTSFDDEHFESAVEMENLAAIAEQQGLAIVAGVRDVDDWPPTDGAWELIRDVAVTLADVDAAVSSTGSGCPEVAEALDHVRARHARLIK